MTHNHMTRQRRRLFTRLEDNLPPLRLTGRDMRILKLLFDYRFLTTPQMHALLGGSKRNITERLSRLFHHGYVDRPPQQISLRIFGYRHVIHALALNGARYLAQYFEDASYLQPRWTQNNNAVKAPHFLHTLMISRFRVCLSLACDQRQDVFLSTWFTPDVSLTRYDMDNRKVWVKPDAYFVLTAKAADEEHRAHFFLEADRGTMTYADLRRKLVAYWLMRTQRRLVADWVPQAYRVLTISPTPSRAARLVELARDADPKRRGSLLFHFCSECDFDLEHPECVFERIWQTPADSTLRHLLERKGGTLG